MGLLTTCIGAYPKPDYVNLPDWFEDLDTPDPTYGWAEAMDAMGEEAIEILNRGTWEAVLDQVNAGIDIPTDGETCWYQLSDLLVGKPEAAFCASKY